MFLERILDITTMICVCMCVCVLVCVRGKMWTEDWKWEVKTTITMVRRHVQAKSQP